MIDGIEVNENTEELSGVTTIGNIINMINRNEMKEALESIINNIGDFK